MRPKLWRQSMVSRWPSHPPYVGKWLSGVEVLWSVVKQRYRKTTRESRGTAARCVSLARNILSEVKQERCLLLRLFLPAWRWTLALLHATFTNTRLTYKNRRILLPEVHSAAVNYARRLRQGDVEDDPGDILGAEVSTEMPSGLQLAMLPRAKVGTEEVVDEAEVAEAIFRGSSAEASAEGPRKPEGAGLRAASSSGGGDAAEQAAADDALLEDAISRPAPSAAPEQAAVPRPRLDAVQRDRVREKEVRQLLRTSRIRCTCGLPIHAEKCRLRDPVNGMRLRTRGEDVMSMSDLNWLSLRLAPVAKPYSNHSNALFESK